MTSLHQRVEDVLTVTAACDLQKRLALSSMRRDLIAWQQNPEALSTATVKRLCAIIESHVYQEAVAAVRQQVGEYGLALAKIRATGAGR
jgi:hypothetical protein